MHSDIHSPYTADAAQVRQFDEMGFVHLRQVLNPDTLRFYEQEISRVVRQCGAPKPDAELTTYDKAFTQITNVWLIDDFVKDFVFSRRLASLASGLLGVKGVRLYHDQALYKERSGGHTPWHADQFYWPLASDRVVTVWIPLQDTPLDMGPLSFSARSQTFTAGRDLPISDDSDRELARLLEEQRFEYVEEPYALGDVSYHLGWTYHRAGPNSSGRVRKVMTMIYMDEDMVLKTPENDFQQADWQAFCPGSVPGQPISTPLNPVLYHAL